MQSNPPNTKAIIATWPEWMRDYKLTPNSIKQAKAAMQARQPKSTESKVDSTSLVGQQSHLDTTNETLGKTSSLLESLRQEDLNE